MTTLGLVVKGGRHEAAVAAANRGIPLVFVREIAGFAPTTLGTTGVEQSAKVCSWFCEHPDTPPFPDGTLLLYTFTGGPMDGFVEAR